MDWLFVKLKMDIPTKEGRNTLIGACLFKLGSGLVLGWGAINLYFLSYFLEMDDTFEMQTATAVFGGMIVAIAIAAVISV